MARPITARGRSLSRGISRIEVRVVSRPITSRGRVLYREVNNGRPQGNNRKTN